MSVPEAQLRHVEFSEIPGIADDELVDAWPAFLKTCVAISQQQPVLRSSVVPNEALKRVCSQALSLASPTRAAVSQFFQSHFRAFEIVPHDADSARTSAFLTGYYEPIIDGALQQTPDFTEPLLSRPDDLIAIDPKECFQASSAGITSGRRKEDGNLEPYPDRRSISLGALGHHSRAIAWVRDGIEAFMIHVQGSAALRLGNGQIIRLSYAGRNGHPYTSIGKLLVDSGQVALAEMSLARLKRWVRDNGQNPGEKGRELLLHNASYIFFELDNSRSRSLGPIGGSGVPLTPLRSIAVDRNIWSYGLPFWIDASLPWREPKGVETPFRRLMIAQDTGSAIIGPSRADIYFGSGEDAGTLAGSIRHRGRMIVFLPAELDERSKR
jgi:membrane-bound lytic murein transglycosylase A